MAHVTAVKYLFLSQLSPFRRLLCVVRSVLRGLVGGPVGPKSAQHATTATSQTCYRRGVQIFQKSTSHLRILGARSRLHNDDRRILDAAVGNLAATATWRPVFVRYWATLSVMYIRTNCEVLRHGLMLRTLPEPRKWANNVFRVS